jgi:hypothetical protein
MGCKCKGGSSKEEIVGNKSGELNITGKLLKIPAGIVLTLIYVVLSPFIVIYIWWLAMRYVFGYEAVLFAFLNKFKKKYKKEEEDFVDDFNEDDYELVDVEVIK